MFWLTDAKLVAAISEVGGLGVLGPHTGQTFLPKDNIERTERTERMRKEIQKMKELTSKLFDFNIFYSGQNQDYNLNLC